MPQALGFTLEDVAGLLQLNNTDACAKTCDLAAQKLALIKTKAFRAGDYARCAKQVHRSVRQTTKEWHVSDYSDSSVGC